MNKYKMKYFDVYLSLKEIVEIIDAIENYIEEIEFESYKNSMINLKKYLKKIINR